MALHGDEGGFGATQSMPLPAPPGKEVQPGPKIFDILKTSG
jgi:hypothetical protein